MPALGQDLRDEVIERLIGQIRANLKGDAARVERFTRQFLADVATEFLLEPTLDDLYGAVISMWGHARLRDEPGPKIRVYNPIHESHGWHSTHTVIEIVTDDMPFIVDSVVNGLNRDQLTVHLLIHPIVRVARDDAGALQDVLEPGSDGDGSTAESIVHVEIDQRGSADALEALHAQIAHVLDDVRTSVEDWPEMRGRIADLVEDLRADPPPIASGELEEGIAFLEWIYNDNFTLLGVRDYKLVQKDDKDFLKIDTASGLGVLREVSVDSALRHKSALARDAAEFARRKHLLIITKASTRSTVHRNVYMDYIGVRRFDQDGNVTGERRFIGLFTSSAYNRNPREIPLLRKKVDRVMERSRFASASHNAKAMLNILETYPRDELFQISTDQLFEIAHGVLHLEERQRIRLFVRQDTYARFYSCLVYVPRERYSTNLRQRIEEILLAAFKGEAAEFTTQVSDQPMARIHYILRAPRGADAEIDVQQIEDRLVVASRNWTDDLRDALIERMGEARGHELFDRYGDAFEPGFQHAFSAQTAVNDIERMEEIADGAAIAMNLYHRVDAPAGVVHFKVYHGGEPVPLSDILPMLENMGFQVITEHPYTVDAADSGTHVFIHDFLLIAPEAEIDLATMRANFQDAFAHVWHGALEDDTLNRLVVRAGLTWREVAILCGYTRYLQQARITFSQAYLSQTLTRHAKMAGLLIDLFKTRFDPAAQTGADNRAEDIAARFEAGLDKVASLDEDRILRRYLNLVQSTLRTNFYQRNAEGEPKPYIAFKLDSGQVTDLPRPQPWREIWIYSPRVEAIHLRGGEVARGGIRWSDRPEDFRTEVLGLMKAQMVKNALIVPVGAKGGFVVKRPPSEGGREALMEEVVACYKTLIRGMLDLTDNYQGTEIVTPPDVVRLDSDDPYIVAAADKGTATFSDIANGVAAEYGYWLGDAFASGGSAGYDHKAMAITARGAWEAVKRHFRETDKNIQAEDFTVAGVGDMSGDVFGNGMLLSNHIRLVAAFNHLHIFIDPDPEPATGLKERRRLFDLPRSSWSDYDSKAISKGGGVFDRSLKSIKLTPEIKKLFGIKDDAVPPQILLNAILKADVDLLWFGGIGTYVKSSGESQEDADDRANDAIRVNGDEIRAKVIGEGANLGVTQRGRIEFALAGGRINMDAVDNSGGVDASDHEVNIKILLGDVVQSGDMTLKQRNALLEGMTDEVAALVLRGNYQQSQSISVMSAQASDLLDRHARFMRALERTGQLDRAIEFLPSEETIQERRELDRGLTRPEIAVLLSYGKIALNRELLASDLPDDPQLINDLHRYFPTILGEQYEAALENHRLRREIIATHVVNSMVNRVGAHFVLELEARTGASGSDVARAYAVTREIFRLREVWSQIEDLDNHVPAALQTRMLIDIGHLVERSTLWFLKAGGHPLDLAGTIAEYAPGIERIEASLADIVPKDRARQLKAQIVALTKDGVPEALARRVTGLDILLSACDLVRVANAHDYAVETVARIYFELGTRFGMHWLRIAARGLDPENTWQEQAVGAIVDDVFGHQLALTLKVLEGSDGADGDGAIEGWYSRRAATAQQTESLLSELRDSDTVDLSMLTVMSHQLRTLATQ
ncbi:MAG: NAD-glutamate dehydrogenase [Proteobacteria bacterium]|nr:NAD-glutamate dehydrogenase [Pseudomonadota bacterium]